MNKEEERRPKIKGFITYCWDEGAISIEIDSDTVHPHKFLVEDVVLAGMPIYEFEYHDYSVHEYLDMVRSHVFSCKDECKEILDEHKRRGRKTY